MSNPQQTHFFTWCKGQLQIILGISPDESTDIVNSWVKLSDKELDSTLKVSFLKFNNIFSSCHILYETQIMNWHNNCIAGNIFLRDFSNPFLLRVKFK